MAAYESGLKLDAIGADAFMRDVDRAERSTLSFLGTLGDAGKPAGAFQTAVTGALLGIGNMAVEQLANAAGAVKGFISDSVTVAGNFEEAVIGFGAVAGSSLTEAGFDMDAVKQKALDLGQSTAYSAAESIAAMTALAKGGVPVVDIMGEATDATLNLAGAAGLDLAKAADIVAKQLGVWGDTGVDATMASNLLTQAANASTVDVEELALGLANVGGTAKTAGVEFDDLVQTMAMISPSFSSSADAGTSLKTFLSALPGTTGPAIEKMTELGLYVEGVGSAFFDANGQFVGMEETSRLLQEATAGLSEEQKLLAFNTIFGSDAIRAASAISEAGADGFAAMGAAMAASGDAASTAETMQSGYNFALESMRGSIETLQIVIGEVFLPVLADLLNNYITPGINLLTQMVQAVTGNIDVYNALPKSAQGVVDGIKKMITYVQGLIDQFQASISAGATFGEALLGVFETVGRDWSRVLVQWILNALPGILSALGEFRMAVLDFLVANLPMIIEGLKAWATEMVDWVVRNIPALVDALGKFATALGGFLVETGQKLIPVIQEWGPVLWQWIVDNAPKAVEALGGFLSQLIDGISAGDTSLLDTLANWGKMLWQWIANNAPNALAALDGFIKQLSADAIRYAPVIASKIGEWGKALWGWIEENKQPALDKMSELFWQFVGFVRDNLPSWIAALARMGTQLIKWVGEIAPPLISEFGKLLGSFISWLLGTFIPQASGKLIDWVRTDLIPKAGPAIADFGRELVSALGRILWSLGSAAWDIGKGIIDGLVKGITEMGPRILEALLGGVRQAIDAVMRFLGMASPSKLMMEIGMYTGEGLAIGLEDSATQVSNAAMSVTGAMVQPLAAPAAMLAGASSSNVTNNYNYNPTYTGAPVAPSQDFAAMRAWSR